MRGESSFSGALETLELGLLVGGETGWGGGGLHEGGGEAGLSVLDGEGG